MKKQTAHSIRSNQQGVISIILTVFVLIVLSLIVLAFSQATRREERQASDRQLSSQAFYAAESGVNDMISCIRSATSPLPAECRDPERTTCINTPNSDLGDGGNVSYSCVLYDKEPSSIKLSSLSEQQGELFSLQTTGDELNKIKISWNKSDGNNSFSGCTNAGGVNNLPNTQNYASSGCNAGMLRLLFMPVPGGSLSRDQLYSQSYTVFLRPTTNGAGVTSFSPRAAGNDSQGQIIPADCSGQQCEATIQGLPSGGALYLNLRSIYMPNAVSIECLTITNTACSFNRAQVKIDSTGKAAGLTKRIQVRMPLYETYHTSQFVVDSMNGVCKLLATYPTVGSPGNPGYVQGFADDGCD